MYLNVSTKKTIKRDLENLFNMDADFSGDNGQDYLMDKARESGFESNAAYFANEVYNQFKNSMDLEKMVQSMYVAFVQEEGHYWDIDLETNWCSDGLIVAMYARPVNQD